MIVNDELIVVKEGKPVAACRYSSLDDPASTVETQIPNLPFEGKLEHFSICKLADHSKVILSGG